MGRAVLFASVVGFDVVEQRIGDLSATSGVSHKRFREILATGRHALSVSSPKVPDQHVVSKALLRRFYGPTSQGDRLLAHSLQYGRAKPQAARAVGKLEHFVKIDSRETEQLWGATEQDLPAAIDAARTRRIFMNPKHVGVIKDAIALHFARSLETLESADLIWKRGLAAARTAFLADQSKMEQLFYLKHGFHAASGSAISDEIADDLLATTVALYESGVAFRLRVVDVFEAARDLAKSARLQIMRPMHGEFLVGDVPAISIDTSRRAIGMSGGVSFGNATTVILPLSPTRLAALSASDSFDAMPAAAVQQFNAFQLAMARTQVYFRPRSGLEAFILSQRPPTGDERPSQ